MYLNQKLMYFLFFFVDRCRFLTHGKEKMEEHRNKPKPSARNQFSFQNSFYRSLRDWSVFLAPSQFETSSQKSLKENKRGRTRYKRVKVRYIVHNDDGTRTVCKPPERKPWVHRHRISIGYWATHGLGESNPYKSDRRGAVIPGPTLIFNFQLFWFLFWFTSIDQ